MTKGPLHLKSMATVTRPDERGGQGGPAPRGPGVWGAREESKNTVGDPGFYQWGIQDFDKGGGAHLKKMLASLRSA